MILLDKPLYKNEYIIKLLDSILYNRRINENNKKRREKIPFEITRS